MSVVTRLRGQEGLTLIEVVVAAMIVVVGLLGTLAATTSGRRLTAGSQRDQQAYAYAQSYLGQLTARPFAQLGLSSLPTPETDTAPADATPSTPAAYLSDCTTTCSKLAIHQDPMDRTSAAPTGVTSPETLVTVGSHGADPTVPLPGDAGFVYQYVTQASDLCVSDQCAKRVIVAVKLAGSHTQTVTKPVWVSSVVSDPDASAQ